MISRRLSNGFSRIQWLVILPLTLFWNLTVFTASNSSLLLFDAITTATISIDVLRLLESLPELATATNHQREEGSSLASECSDTFLLLSIYLVLTLHASYFYHGHLKKMSIQRGLMFAMIYVYKEHWDSCTLSEESETPDEHRWDFSKTTNWLSDRHIAISEVIKLARVENYLGGVSYPRCSISIPTKKKQNLEEILFLIEGRLTVQ